MHVLAGAGEADMLPCAWLGLSVQYGVMIWFVGLLKGSQIEVEVGFIFLLVEILISVFVLFVLLSVAFP